MGEPTYPETERETLMRRRQADRVMPRIEHLLEAWEALPREMRTEPELAELLTEIEIIYYLMGPERLEGEG